MYMYMYVHIMHKDCPPYHMIKYMYMYTQTHTYVSTMMFMLL